MIKVAWSKIDRRYGNAARDDMRANCGDGPCPYAIRRWDEQARRGLLVQEMEAIQ